MSDTTTPNAPDNMAINERVAWTEGFNAGASWAFVRSQRIDEARIERAADELRIIDDEWDAMSPMTNRGMAERMLRAALEVDDE